MPEQSMLYTPFANLSDKELLNTVRNKKDPTDLEIELMLRLEDATEEIESLSKGS